MKDVKCLLLLIGLSVLFLMWIAVAIGRQGDENGKLLRDQHDQRDRNYVQQNWAMSQALVRSHTTEREGNITKTKTVAPSPKSNNSCVLQGQ